MLVVQFDIGVKKSHEEEVREVIMNTFGIEILRCSNYEGDSMLGENEPVVYFVCYAPPARLKMISEYLDKEFADTAVLSF